MKRHVSHLIAEVIVLVTILNLYRVAMGHNVDAEPAKQTQSNNISYDEAGHAISIFVPARNVTDDNLSQITELESIQKIQLGGCAHLTPNGITNLLKLQHLRRLEICGYNPERHLIPVISRLQTLTQLKFAASTLGTNDAQYLSSMTNLVELTLSHPMTLGTNGLLSLTNLPHLESLNFGDRGVPDDLVNQLYKSASRKTFKISQLYLGL